MGVGALALSAWVAEECNRVLGRELTEEEERLHADLLNKAKKRELDTLIQFKVFPPLKTGAQTRELVGTRWALI